MASLFGGINKGAVAPAMMKYSNKLDQQLNDPNAYYKDQDENLLLNTNRAYDMADRGQIARSEVPTVGYLMSNVKDTNTRAKATGMDIMNRRRFGTSQNKVEMLSPANFTKSMTEETTTPTENTPVATPVAGLNGITPATTVTTSPATTPVATPVAGLNGITPEMKATMAATPSTFGNKMMINNDITAGRGGRELGQNEQEYSDLEAEYMAKSIGWDRKNATTTEKRVLENGDIQERTIYQKPVIQAGYDENMGISTPRVSITNVDSGWNTIKKAKKATPKAGTTIAKVFKDVSTKVNFKDVLGDAMDLNQDFINLTKNASIETKMAVKDYSELSSHQLAMENLDENEREEYILENDLAIESYADIVSKKNALEKSLVSSGYKITPEFGTKMYQDSFNNAKAEYETVRPLGMNKDMKINFKDNNRVDIGYDKNKRAIPVGFDDTKEANKYYKFSMLDTDTGEIVFSTIPVEKFTADVKTKFLNTFGRSGGQYYGKVGSKLNEFESDKQTGKGATLFSTDKEETAYKKVLDAKIKFDDMLKNVTDPEEARALWEGREGEDKWFWQGDDITAVKSFKTEVDEIVKDFPSLKQRVNEEFFPKQKDGKFTTGDIETTFKKNRANELGWAKKQSKAIGLPSEIKKVKIGNVGDKSNEFNYMTTSTPSGVVVKAVSSTGKKVVVGTIPLKFTNSEDINTMAKQYILKWSQKMDKNLNSEILEQGKITTFK